MNIAKIRIIDTDNNRDLAYLYPEDTAWNDPFGGEFTVDEQCQMSSVAEGKSETIFMHAGTKNARTIPVRLALNFK